MMQRYSIFSPLVAVRLCPPNETRSPGALTFLPSDAVVEACGPSDVKTGMIEVSWEHQRFKVFLQDLETRAIPSPGPSFAD